MRCSSAPVPSCWSTAPTARPTPSPGWSGISPGCRTSHVADLVGEPQLWLSAGWHKRFNLPFAAAATGYGQTIADVAAVRAGTDLLLGYFDAVHERTIEFLGTLHEDDFSRIVDTRWTPPVTLAVRLVSVIGDDLEHAGQAAFVRGLAMRAGLH